MGIIKMSQEKEHSKTPKGLDALDRNMSSMIHRMESKIIAFALIPSVYIHNNWRGVVAIVCMFGFYGVDQNAFLEHRETKEGENLAIMVGYVVHVLLLLTCSKKLKFIFKRERPIGPNEGAANYRSPFNMRGREHNHSFPSGDVCQAANFMLFLTFYQSAFWQASVALSSPSSTLCWLLSHVFT